MKALEKALRSQEKKNIPGFRAGDSVKVHVRVREGEKERIQIFEGVVLRRRGEGTGSTFTVRKVSYGVGVERIFPLHSPLIKKIIVAQRGSVRQSRIYYLRGLQGKAARVKERAAEVASAGEGAVAEAPAATEEQATPAASEGSAAEPAGSESGKDDAS